MPHDEDVIVIYHANCTDGFASAYTVSLQYPNARFLAASYYEPLPEGLQGKMVVIVDFSYPAPVMFELAAMAKEVIWIDHHADSEETALAMRISTQCRNVSVIHRQDRSGAWLTWEYFMGARNMPDWVALVDDRDRWQWKLEDSRAFYLAAETSRGSFADWKGLVDNLPSRIAQQKPVAAFYETTLDSILKNAHPCMLGGVKGMAVNAPYVYASDIGAVLAKMSGTFGLVWFMRADGKYKVSLRSGENFDVRPLAHPYGGGGHPGASGMIVDKMVWEQR